MFMDNELKKIAAQIAALHIEKARIYKTFEAIENDRKQLIELNKHILTPADYALVERYAKEDKELLNIRISAIDAELAAVPRLLNQLPDLKKYLDVYMPQC